MIRIKNGVLRKSIGVILVIAGVIALIVPIVPGWLLIITGLILLRYPPIKRYLLEIRKRRVFNHDKNNFPKKRKRKRSS